MISPHLSLIMGPNGSREFKYVSLFGQRNKGELFFQLTEGQFSRHGILASGDRQLVGLSSCGDMDLDDAC